MSESRRPPASAGSDGSKTHGQGGGACLNSPSAHDDKARWRRELSERRRALDEVARRALSARLAARVTRTLDRLTPSLVAVYAPLSAEPDPFPLPPGLRLVFPRMELDDQLSLREATLADLVPGPGGLREPGPDALRVAIEAVDLFIVPGLGFDRRGVRLGRGRGHYDRLLAQRSSRAWAIGVCFETQLVDALPSEPHDERVDLVVTDARSLDCRVGGSSDPR